MVDLFTLENRHLVARFLPSTGDLVHLSDVAGGPSLVQSASCRHYDEQSRRWTSERPEGDGAAAFEVVSVRGDGEQVETVLRGAAVQITRTFRLAKQSPLLEVNVRVQGLADGRELAVVGFPHVVFSVGCADSYEDERDLYFDGAELGGGRQIPCWRVFFRTDGDAGVLLATRTKQQMRHMEIRADGFRVCPHMQLNYSTAVHRPALAADRKRRYQASFELAPWRRDRHAAILRAGKLNVPVDAGDPPPAGKPRVNLKGKVFRGTRIAPASAVSDRFAMNKWFVARMPWAQGGKALFAAPGVKPPALTLDPKLKGVHRITVGVGNGGGIGLQLSGDPHASFRIPPRSAMEQSDAFRLYLSGRQQGHEVFFGVADLTGRTLRLSRFPNRHTATVIDYVRFEKLSPAQERAWRRRQQQRPRVQLSGFNDIPDISRLTDAVDPDPRVYAANIWEHARCGYEKVFWRIDGQCSDYPSKVNTMRYISAKTHGVYNPQAKSYGRVLKKVDMLRLAVEAGKRYGVEVWGWMRFNNYTGNVQSDFYEQNPQFWEEWEHGRKGGKLCLALPEVRKHKIDILVEAAGYGLAGLNLGFLRHPPVLLYHPVLVESFQARFGELPPRDPEHKDPRYVSSLPPSNSRHTRWFQHRADYMTLFGRELRQALRDKALEHVKVSLWVRPNHCLFDGIDLPAWLDEGLCDEVVADTITNYAAYDPIYKVRPQWKKMVQAKARLVHGMPHNQIAWVRKHVPGLLADGYDGLCTYESDFAVLETPYIQFYESLRR